MKKMSFLMHGLLVILLLMGMASRVNSQELGLHPVILLDNSDCENIQKIVSYQKDAKSIFKPMKKLAGKYLKQSPNPIIKINYEGLLKDDPLRVESVQKLEDMNKLQTLAYVFVGTKDVKYASKAKEYILAWAKTYVPEGNPINENKLTPIFSSYLVVKSSFSAEEKNLTENWIRSIAKQTIKAGDEIENEKGNWKSKRLKIVGLAGTMFNDLDLLKYVVNGVKDYIDSDLFGDGTSYDLRMRDAMSYHCGGMEPLLSLLLTMPSNSDMYTYTNADGGSVKKSVEYVLPYATGEKTYLQWQNSKIEFDRTRWEKGDAQFKPGSAWNPKSALDLFIYAQFYDDKFKEIVLKLSASVNQRFPVWESVLLEAKKMSNEN